MALESIQPPAPELSLQDRQVVTPSWEDVPLLDLAGAALLGGERRRKVSGRLHLVSIIVYFFHLYSPTLWPS